ncbi:hypothetical protein [Dyadobacter sp. CY351]|uniref:hypothetical protein n=1 Tax=Dyadobacter sp. CY351 TaxID=2909337 RepID=UPI001F316BE8|nr:hypothetical protein [Dyadobacter sp. CY351]MCF2520944.1 hypothetical protein [Dyadobacter sp. CY351]
MAINRMQKRRIEDLIKEIASGTFSLTDVRMLFMDLREHTQNNPVFREYADFVAHSKRDRGIIWDALNFYRNRAQYLKDHFAARTGFDVKKPFPSYVKEMFGFIITRLAPTVLTSNKLRQSDFDKFIRNEIVPVPGSDMYQFSTAIQQKLAANEIIPVLDVLYPLVNGCEMPEAISFDELFDGLLTAIKTNGIPFNEPSLARQFEKITLLILADLHKSEYKMKDNSTIVCRIKGMEYREERNTDRVQVFAKYLHLAAELPAGDLSAEGATVPIELIPTVLSTKLPSIKWCTPNTFVDLGNVKGGDSDHDFTVQNFKLTPVLPYVGAGIVDVEFRM